MSTPAKVPRISNAQFTQLPLEIIINILENLDKSSLLTMMLVQKRFKEIIIQTSNLNNKLVLYFDSEWDSEVKKNLLLQNLEDGRTFTRLDVKLLNLYFTSDDPLISFIKNIVQKFNLKFEYVKFKNSTFILVEFIKLLTVMPNMKSIILYHNNIGSEVRGVEDLNQLKLEHLTELEIISAGYDGRNEKLKFTTPQLTRLTSNINDVSELVSNKPNLKELNIFEKTNFFTDSVQKSVNFRLQKFTYRYTDSNFEETEQKHIKSFLKRQNNIIDLELNALTIDFQSIIEIKNLKKLSLKLYQVPKEEIFMMSNESVVHLNLSFNQIRIPPDFDLINRFCKIFPNIQKLELGALNRLGFKINRELTLNGLLNLKEVEIWSLRQSMLREVKIGQTLTKVKMYPIDADEPAEESEWITFANNNPKLLELELEDFPDPNIMDAITFSMKNLEVLILGNSECRTINLNEKALDIINNNCKRLRKLEIYMDLSDEQAKMLMQKFQEKSSFIQVVLTHCDYVFYEASGSEEEDDESESDSE